MITVLGAHSTLGRHVVLELARSGVRHRVLLPTRQVVPRDELRLAEVVIGAPDDGHAIEAAVEGAEAVIMITRSHPQQVAREQLAIAACQLHRMPRLVKLSSSGAHADAPFRVGRWHWHTESVLAATRLEWTIVRAHRPMQYLTSQLPSLLAQHAIYGCQGNGRSADIDQRDIAAVLVATALRGLYTRRTITITGPEALSGAETAAQLGEAMTQPVAYVDCTSRDFVSSQMADGLAAWKAEDRAAWQREVRDGRYALVTDVVERVTSRSPRAFGDFARELAQTLRYASPRSDVPSDTQRTATPSSYAAPT